SKAYSRPVFCSETERRLFQKLNMFVAFPLGGINMTYNQFAAKYHLKLKLDPQDDTLIIPGKRGQSHLYEYGDNRIGVMILPDTPSARAWRAARKAFKKVGMKIVQNGDYEGAATFDPENDAQVQVALKYARVRPRRVPSPAQLAALAKARSAIR